MDFIKNIRVSQERTEAGFGAEIDPPPAILDPWKIGRIRVEEFSPTQSDEARIFLWLERIRCHTLRLLLNFRNEDFKGIDCQSVRRFGGP